MRALLLDGTELESAGNSEVSGSRPNHESISSSRNPHDMLTEVHLNPHKLNRVHRATTMDSLTRHDHEHPEHDDVELVMTHLMNAITGFPTMIQMNPQKHKLLETQLTTFEGQTEPYNEFKHKLLNHTRPFQKKIREVEKHQFFISLLRVDAIEIW